MTEQKKDDPEVDRFILEMIDSVPHLEALLLVRSSQPKIWSDEEVAERIYLQTPVAARILEDLVRRELISAVPGAIKQFRYTPGERDALLAAVEDAYRHDLIRISNMIHRKAPAAVLEFARAFRFTKER